MYFYMFSFCSIMERKCNFRSREKFCVPKKQNSVIHRFNFGFASGINLPVILRFFNFPPPVSITFFIMHSMVEGAKTLFITRRPVVDQKCKLSSRCTGGTFQFLPRAWWKIVYTAGIKEECLKIHVCGPRFRLGSQSTCTLKHYYFSFLAM